MQVILDSSFARPGSAPIWGGKKGEFRDWTRTPLEVRDFGARSGTPNKFYLAVALYNIVCSF